MFKITITSLSKAMMAMRDEQHSHYISLIGPEDACYNMGEGHIRLTFHDTESEEEVGFISPTKDHVQQALDHTAKLTDDDDLLIHCRAGISRSTAIAIAVACQHGMSPKDALAHIRSIREPALEKGYMVLPNRLIIRYADELLNLNGELCRVIDEYYAGLPLIGVTTLPNRGGWNE